VGPGSAPVGLVGSRVHHARCKVGEEHLHLGMLLGKSETDLARAGTQLEDGVAGSYAHGLVHPAGDVPFDFVDERPFLVPTGRERVPDLPALVCCLIAHRDRF
jgi:hypothetical protein